MSSLTGKWAVVRVSNNNSCLDTTDDKDEALTWAKEMNLTAGVEVWEVVTTIGGKAA